jgi:hypothetical protein
LRTNPSTISLAPLHDEEAATRRALTKTGLVLSAILALFLASTPFTPRLPLAYRLLDFAILAIALAWMLGRVASARLVRPVAIEFTSEGLVLSYPGGAVRSFPWAEWPRSISIVALNPNVVKRRRATLHKLVLSRPLRHSFWISADAAEAVTNAGIEAGLLTRSRGGPLYGLFGKESDYRELRFRAPPTGLPVGPVGRSATP